MIGTAHELVHNRRVEVLARHLADLLPRDGAVLDVGAGDGLLAHRVAQLRPDLRFSGVDVLVRDDARIPIQSFDGTTLPFADRAFDAVILIDVVHHASDQQALLRETARVAKQRVVIKDHMVRGPLARHTLRFMDWVGNARHGVALPYAYWNEDQWSAAFERFGLRVSARRDRLGLYPWPASLLFERRLHFIVALEPRIAA
jgi:SAM-dependent methyltransferase